MKIQNMPPSKPSKETVYVDIEDEITSIIDKLENTKEKVVALVLPKRSTVLQSVVNMRLLKRSADNAGKNIVLISGESTILALAGMTGIHVAKNLTSKPEIPPGPEMSAEETVAKEDDSPEDDGSESETELSEEDLPIKIDYDRSIGELAGVQEDENGDIIELDDEEETASRETKTKDKKIAKNMKFKVPNFDKFRLMLLSGGLLLIGLIIFIFMAVSVLPKATINIQTTSTPVSTSVDLTTSDKGTAYDDTQKTIPVVLKASDQTSTQQVPATGQLNSGDKAKGTITFVNCSQSDTLAGTNRTIPAGTGVSANGFTFITQTSVTVGPSHFAGDTCKKDVVSDSVNMVAQSGGAAFNQDSTTYKVSGFSTVAGTGSKTTGGTDNIQTVVAQADLDAAKQKITSASSDTFSKTFQAQLGDQGYYVIASTLKLSEPQTTSTPALGQPSATATVTVKITYSLLVVKKDDLKTAIKSAFASQIDKTKQKVDDTDLLKGATITFSNQSSPTAGTLNISVDASAVPIIDSSSVKKQVKGLKSGDIKKNLGSITGVKSVDVKYSPFWVSKVPKNDAKITVVITYTASAKSGQ